VTPATALPLAAIPVGVLGGCATCFLFAAARTHPVASGGRPERLALRLMGVGVILAVLKAYGLAAFAPLLISIGVCVALIFRGWARRPYASAAAITSAVGRRSERSATPLIEAIVRVGAGLDLTVIAVGVADDAARRMPVRAGCRLAQADAFGRPMPAEHMNALLSAQLPDSDSIWPQWFGDRDGLPAGPR
jgi:hypothetical protein